MSLEAGVKDVAGCVVDVALEPDVVIRISGSAESAAADDLERLFSSVHAECERLGATAARVDLRELEFMNSSCFKSFVSWVIRIEELPEPQRYRIVLAGTDARHWQKRSLHALRSMGAGLIDLDVEPPPVASS